MQIKQENPEAKTKLRYKRARRRSGAFVLNFKTLTQQTNKQNPYYKTTCTIMLAND